MHKDIERKILLNPGPATTTETVKMAQIVPDICPREKEFGQLMKSVATDLTKIVKGDKDYKTVLFGGSGTAAMESVISSVVPNEKSLLIIINGAYGDRIRKIAETYSIPFKVLEFKRSQPINFEEVDSFLQSNEDINYMAMVHHETTTGILNSIGSFSELGKKYGHTLILDAISSYAGIPIDLKKTPIDFLVSTSNKCIQGIAGLAFVISNKAELQNLKGIPNRSFYLSLYDQYKYMEKTGQMRFTPPVQTIYAIRQAIDEFFEEGYLNRYNRYTENWHTLRKGLQNLGFQLLLNSKDESHILLTVIDPNNENYDFDKLHDLLYEKGFTIYPGKVTKINSFRLSNMGDLSKNDIISFLDSLRQVLIEMEVEL